MKVSAVIVLYNPNFDELKKNLLKLNSQVDDIYIVDNTPYKDLSSEFDSLNFKNIKYIPLKQNVGIAKAQNIAIQKVSKTNSEFIFFLDQDSFISENIIKSLTNKYLHLVNQEINVGGIGPRPFNREQNKKYLGSIKKGIDVGNNVSEVTEIICSASLIPVKALQEIGGMDESLFIDGVDHEWCWRATNKRGYHFFIDEDSLLSHKLGEGDRRFLFKKVAIPTPFRTYFQFRNYFLLSRRKYVPLYWKLSNGVKYLVKFFYYPLFIQPRFQYLKRMIMGIKDGILNKKS